jgi:hypothetical protein
MALTVAAGIRRVNSSHLGSGLLVSDFAKASSDRPILGAGFSHVVVACVRGTL